MLLEWNYRNDNRNLVDYFKKEKPNTLIRVATYNIKHDRLTVYQAHENAIVHQNLLEHIKNVADLLNYQVGKKVIKRKLGKLNYIESENQND